MKEILENLKKWDYITQLPDNIAGFSLNLQLEQEENKLLIFCFENKQLRRSFSVIYDSATKDFLCSKKIGLTEYFDAEFIFGDMKMLESALKNRLEKVVFDLANFNITQLGSVFLSKQILDWSYAKKLPKEVSGFELFIKPEQPLCVINGSYIIMDYSDFVSQSNLIIYYNLYRDEFFGEMRIKLTPVTTALFDANSLEELAESLEGNLVATLNKMSAKIDGFK